MITHVENIERRLFLCTENIENKYKTDAASGIRNNIKTLNCSKQFSVARDNQ